MKKDIFAKILQYIVFIGAGVGIMWWFYNSQNTAFQAQLALEGKQSYPLWHKLVNDFRSVNLFWIAATLFAFSISNWSRAVRWNMLIHPLGHRPSTWNSFYAVNISYFTNLWMSRAGEFVRAGALARAEGMSTSKVMGTVVIDRLLDMLTLLIIVGFAFLINYDVLWGFLDKNIGDGTGKFRLLEQPIFWAFIVFGLGLLGSIWLLRDKIMKLPIAEKVWQVAKKFIEGTKTFKQVEKPFIFAFHSINIWVMYYFMTYLCFFAFAPTENLTPLAALMVFVFGTFGMVIPSPGGMGTYHVLATAALSLYAVKSDDAFSFANIMFFTIQIFYNIVAGALSIYLLARNKKRKNAPPSQE